MEAKPVHREVSRARFVASESRDRCVVSRADYDTINAVLESMTANCCRGSDCAEGSVVRAPMSSITRDE